MPFASERLTCSYPESGVEMAAVCDVYEPTLEKGLKAASTGAKAHDNYKRVLDDPSIHVAVIATPDHWHAQMVIDAVEAGEDVYVEKPMVHRIDDGFRVIDAERRTMRVVQVGMQRRSFDLFSGGPKVDGPARRCAPRQFLVAEQPAIPLSQSACR